MNEAPLAHPSPEQLAAFGLGRLGPAERAAVEQHVAECDSCCRQLELLPPDALIALVCEAASTPGSHGLIGTNHGQPAARPAGPEPAGPPELRDHPRYRILGPIGSGGMGAVYKAEHRLMERTVALKVINRSLVERPSAVERFTREVKTAARMAHPNIVAAYDAEQAGDLLFLVMEYVEGVTLAQLVEQNGRLPVDQACDYVHQAALGLQHASECGMVHRDLKPHNLMLTPKGVVKILDFGLARFVSENAPAPSLTLENAGMGTPDYIAPEQATDASQADIRADIYSLGCTLYYLLTGHPPFTEGTAMQRVISHIEELPKPVKDLRDEVPAELNAVLDRMLAKDPARRFQKPAEVVQALAPFVTPRTPATTGVGALPDTETRAYPFGDPKRPSRAGSRATVGRSFGRWVAVIAVVLGGVGLLAWAVLRVNTSNGMLIIKTDDPNVQVIVKQNGEQVTIIDLKTAQQVELKAGTYEVALAGKPKGLRLSTNGFTLTRDGKEIVEVQREAPVGKPPVAIEGPGPAAGDRAVAEWVLRLGGAVDVQVGDQSRHVALPAGLPMDKFQVTGVRLVRNNLLTNAGLANLQGLTGLVDLNLGYSRQIGDEGLEHIKGLTSLQQLHLEATATTDRSLERVIKGLKNLRKLNLYSTGISDAGLTHLGGLTQLTDLELHYNPKVTDAGLEHLKGLKELRVVHLEYTGITDAGLAIVKEWAPLENLNLQANAITDQGILHLQGLKNLKSLKVTGTRVTQAGAQKLQGLLPGCTIITK